ncbi:MAG: hypothetical protein ISS23_00490 [Nanoarchaeota archaeon]|nr:hypothetical protein [Nanoarchaeota archaeon]
MRRIKEICLGLGSLALVAFATPTIAQEYINNKEEVVTISSAEETKEWTERDFFESLFSLYIHTFKTGDNLEQSLEKTGVNLKSLAKYLTGKDDKATIEMMYQSFKEETNLFLSGETAYLVKKVFFSQNILEEQVKAIDSKSTKEFETIVMSGDNPGTLGYKQKNQGLELYLIRADSKDDAIQKSMADKCTPSFYINGFVVSTPESLKEWDSLFTDVIKDSSKMDLVLDKFGLD